MEEWMKKNFLTVCFLTLFCTIFSVGAALAEEKATKEECVARVKEAATMVKEIGVEATLAKINDPNGPFQWKDSYVFCHDLEGVMLAHPNPKLIGKNLLGLKDASGKMHVAEYMSVAKTSGEGWVTYAWPKPGEKVGSPKVAFVYRVPGENLVLLAGIYE
jgi:signal transduction histidine kinase